MPRLVSCVTGLAPEGCPVGATQTFSTPSKGASQLIRSPSGLIFGEVRSGLSNSTLRGISGTGSVTAQDSLSNGPLPRRGRRAGGDQQQRGLVLAIDAEQCFQRIVDEPGDRTGAERQSLRSQTNILG